MTKMPTRIKTVPVAPKVLALCFVKARHAAALTRDEVVSLMAWCDCQREDLWADMNLQEILNVYRATAEYETFEAWSEDDRKAAHAAWNSAVIDPGNKMVAVP